MKTANHTHARRARFLALAALAFANAPLPAEQPPTSMDIIADMVIDPVERRNTATSITYNIHDGVTLTLRNAQSTAEGGVFALGGNLIIKPTGPLETGRVIFENNKSTAQVAVIFVNTGRAADITNAVFRNNSSAQASGAGVFRNHSSSGIVNFSRVLFEGNSAQIAGAIRSYAAAGLNISSGTFLNNYTLGTASTAGMGGAIQVANETANTKLTDLAFISNRAGRDGGAIMNSSYAGIVLTDILEFTDNWTGRSGGAIYDNSNGTGGNAIEFIYTGSSNTRDFVFSGNAAGGLGTLVPAATLASGTYTMIPLARSGGFYYANNAGQLKFDIAAPVTLSIGRAGNPAALDSIATSDSGTGAKLDKTGGGRLILHADNSYFQGTVSANEGALLLGNQDAQLGGIVTVASGATFGGAGTLTTLKQNGTVFAGRTRLTASGGARIQVGTDTAVDAETLSVAGDLAAGNGVVFSHDLFTSGSASLLSVENFNLSGSATINLGLLATGAFPLIEWSGAGLAAPDLSRLALTVDGVANNPRSNGALSLAGNQLVVTNTVNNLIMKWTGAEGSNWMRRPSGAQKNWADASGSDENRFFNADSVTFDGAADVANPGNRAITIEAGGVSVSGMTVAGGARYEFQGEGGITADAASVGNASFAPTGMLKKSGEGELVFSNSAANTFQGGIDIAGGVIAFDNAGQLGSGTGGFIFSDSGTLRAAATVAGVLEGGMAIAAGKTATVEVGGGGVLVYSGTLASGPASSVLRKTGMGSLQIEGNNSAATGTVAIDAGSVILAADTASLGGAITVNTGATLGGIGSAGANGGVKIAAGGILDAGIDAAQSSTLTVTNLQLTGSAIVRLGLFTDAADATYQKSDRVIGAGTALISGANIIDLTSFASGTFNLGNLTGLAANGSVTLSGMTIPSGGRLSAELGNAGGDLRLVTASDKSREVKWTGSGGATWNLVQKNWAAPGVDEFSYGDHVVFDGASDSANPQNRAILIDAQEVRVSDMTVQGGANHTFTGGGIHSSSGNVLADALGGIDLAGATGKLIKQGGGTLAFANAKNTFLGGVDIGGGVISVTNGNQLSTSDTTGITFTGDATLRVAADDVVLDDTITIGAGRTGVVDSNARTMTVRGAVIAGADAVFAKDGAGTALLEADVSGITGTLAVRGGVLQIGAADLLTQAGGAAIVVGEGATLDLDGHDQSLANLTGGGTVALGAATLAYTVAAGEGEFAGGFAGSGTVVKRGAGKWILSGASDHTGGFVYEDGVLGLANSFALGEGALNVGAANGLVSIEATGLNVANEIAMGSGTLSIVSNGREAEFSGKISGNTLALEGTGTLALSGNNSYTRLEVNNARTIARRAEAVSGNVSIRDGSVLEFKDIAAGQVLGNITGDRVVFTASTLSLNGANDLRNFTIGAGSRITAASTGALGGANADVTVRDGGWLVVINEGTLGRGMDIDGGTVVFGTHYKMSSLTLAGQMNFTNGGEIRLGGLLPTGIYTAAVAAGGIPNMPAYDANQGGMFMLVDIIEGNKLQITAYNKALEPGKDIVVGFDAMLASMRSVYAHISEEFLTPLIDKKVDSPERGFWFRAIGSFAEYGDDFDHLGYSGSTYAGIVGYDWISDKNIMAGAYAGFSRTRLETTNNATTDIDLPHVGFYGAFRKGKLYASADFTMGFGSADTERREEHNNIVTGIHHFDTVGGSVELGCMLPLFAKGGLRPSVGLHYMNLRFHDYAETGKGAVRLDDFRTHSLQAVFGCDASKELALPWGLPGMVDLGAGWRQNLSTKASNVWATMVDYPEARLQIRGDEYDSSGVTAGVGLRMALSRRTLFALAYDFDYIPAGAHDNDTIRHTFNSLIRLSW